MTDLETELRLAFRAKASDIEPPVPPLDLQPGRVPDSAAHRGRRRIRALTRRRWLIPGGAALAVRALGAAALAVGGTVPPQSVAPAAPIQTSVPPYYIALVADRAPGADGPLAGQEPAPPAVATVRDTATGAILARIRPPSPYVGFSMVSGATDDRTFVLLAFGRSAKARKPNQPPPPVAEHLYLLHINPSAASAGGRAQLAALPGSDTPGGSQVDTMALSPDGQALAAIVEGRQGSVLQVDYLTTGTTRTWLGQPTCTSCKNPESSLGPNDTGSSAVTMAWRSNGKALAFEADPWDDLRILDLSKPGSSAVANSTVVPVHGVPVQTWNSAYLTPDGESLFISYNESFGKSSWMGLVRYSALTRKLTAINKLTVDFEGHPTGYGIHANPYADTAADDVVWASYDGSKYIVLSERPGNTAGIVSGGTYTPLAWPVNVIAAAW